MADVQIGNTVRLRGGKVRWRVEDIIGDRAVLESPSGAVTDPPAKLSELTVVDLEPTDSETGARP